MNLLKKSVSVLLAGIMCAQIAVPSLASDNGSNQYKGKILAAINTNYESVSSASFTTAEGGDSETETQDTEIDSECACDVIDDVEILTPEQAKVAAAKIRDMNSPDCIAADYEVGDTKTLRNPDYTDEDKIIEECIYTGEYCTLWLQTGNDNIADEDRENYVSLGEESDRIIKDELELLGDVRIDTDKDGKIAIFIYEMYDVGGYFTSSSLVDRLGKIGNVYTASTLAQSALSDHIDCINIDSDSYYDYQLHTVAHEYQHYICTCYGYYGKTNSTCYENTETYINEGFSDSVATILTDYDRAFNPSYYFGSKKFSLVSRINDSFSYNLGFGFCQYFRTRYAALTGDTEGKYPGSDFYRKVLESRNKSNADNTLGVIADMLYPADKYPELKNTDARCRQLIVDFWMACILNEPTGDHGFNGDEWAENNIRLNDYHVSYRLPGSTGDKIYSGNASLYLINDKEEGTATVTSADDGIVFIGIDSAFYNLTYDYKNWETYSYYGNNFYAKSYDGYSPYRLLGWTSDPDSDAVEYKPGDTITLTKDTTLYAVYTDDAENITVENEYTYSYNDVNSYYKYFKFSAPETGYYTFKTENGYISLFENENSVYPIISDENDSDTAVTYELIKGTEYRIRAEISDAVNIFRLTSEYTNEIYHITYCVGDVTYDELIAGNKTNANFRYYFGRINIKGWSLTEGSDTIDYKYGETITIDDDITLYAVTAPEVLLSEGENIIAASGFKYFAFTPESAGTYKISFYSDDNFDLSDENFNYLCFENDETSGLNTVTFASEEGEEYSLFINSFIPDEETDNATITVTKISDTPQCKLIYDDGIGSVELFCFEGSATYTIQDVPVYYKGYGEFLGWTTEEYYYEGAPLYKTGDTITIKQDTTLYQVWSEDISETLSLYQQLMNIVTFTFKSMIFLIKACFSGTIKMNLF